MSGTDTPMFRQYLALKAEHPDCLLFYRMGDFYELFFDDAVVAAEVLELTLTSRNKNDPEPVPMAGVPHHALGGYLRTLAEAGYKIAIADQVEDPRKAKGLVRREIVRVVTPGVVMDPDDIAPRESCWLLGLHRIRRTWGVALLDVSTGELRVTELGDLRAVADELGRVEPREVVISEGLSVEGLEGALKDTSLTRLDEGSFDLDAATDGLREHFGVADLSGFGCRGMKPAICAAWAALDYATRNARSELPHLSRIRPYTVSSCMVLDQATRRNLELTRPLRGTGRKGTLIALLDRTATAMGGRLLREWLAYPLLDLRRIRARQDGVEALVGEAGLRRELRAGLREVADLERIGGKVAQGTAGARDLAALRRSLEALPRTFELLGTLPAFAPHVPRDLAGDVAADIARWLVDDPPQQITEGGVLREGADPLLDELLALSRDGKGMIAAMADRERAATGISSLKIRFNRVAGYYIEVTKANLHRVPEHYRRQQTLKNNERYFTPELKELEEKILGADERRKALEYERFCELRERVAGQLGRLQALARTVAAVDALASLAEVAADYRYVRPEVVEGRDLEIVAGRHPVVERMDLGERFVPNDIHLSHRGRRLLIVTGPNMSGKSTVMRQVALIVLLAQIGSFVPADRAAIGLCDRIFTRVGASDDLSGGQSTFMVEMSETANILHHATDRSLVVLDEIGRGTSTYDGLAIAWAVAEDIHDRIGARCLFATHYHELVALAERRPHVANVSVAVSEWGEKIIFLRTLREGGASRSYGIQCARLAGMPQAVIRRAGALLKRLERHAADRPRDQLGLFESGEPSPPPEDAPDALREALAGVDPNSLSPMKALELVFQLKELV